MLDLGQRPLSATYTDHDGDLFPFLPRNRFCGDGTVVQQFCQSRRWPGLCDVSLWRKVISADYGRSVSAAPEDRKEIHRFPARRRVDIPMARRKTMPPFRL